MARLDPRTLATALATDLRLALAAGLERDRRVSGGCPWLTWSALAATLVGVALFILGGYQAGFLTLNHLAASWPPGFWEWLTVLGDARLAIALSLFFSLRHPRLFWALILAALVATAFTHGLKPWVSAGRPPAVLALDSFHLIGPALRKSSFPSGHTVTAAVLLGVWLCFIPGMAARLLLMALALTVGLSRVVVGVHWPIDVAAGLAGGWLAAWLGVWLSQRWAGAAAHPGVHLACALLAAGAAVMLILSDGGCAGARGLQMALGLAALGWGFSQYLLGPLGRILKR
ncbi:MAG: phosphatase PAP2 family protein [Chromatiaceae bacterium]|nr:phosphatase PAP2 family protein [Chromatiaceae bacterium]MBP8285169.1 phosphatase PAP2 family protein [Chromatiaceae bacterium]